MASDAATTAAPTFPSDWQPSQSGCMKTDDLWIWDWGAGWDHTPTVLGGPSQTTECFPSGWSQYATFEATQCPPDYTSASCSSSQANSAVTCCPTVYDFKCLEGPVSGSDAKGNVAYQRCISKFATTKSNLITWVNLESSTSTETRRKQNTYEHLFAGAIVYTTPTTTAGTTATPASSVGSGAADSTSTSSSVASADAASSSGGGLSAGASAGIGVGVGVGVLLLLAALFFLFRRRRQARATTAAGGQAPVAEIDPGPNHNYYPSYPASAYPASAYQDPAKPTLLNMGGGGGGYYPASTPSPGLSTAHSSGSPAPPHSPDTVVPGRQEMPPHDPDTVVPGRHEMSSGPVQPELP